jgi:hypothetical protein
MLDNFPPVTERVTILLDKFPTAMACVKATRKDGDE